MLFSNSIKAIFSKKLSVKLFVCCCCCCCCAGVDNGETIVLAVDVDELLGLLGQSLSISFVMNNS